MVRALPQWGAGNVYLLVLSTWKVNIAENPIAEWGCKYVWALLPPSKIAVIFSAAGLSKTS